MKFLGLLALLFIAANASAQSIKDPTRPPTGDAALSGNATQSNGLNLDAILMTQRHRVAVINGVALREGDEHLGTKIKQIETDRVVVELFFNGTFEERVLRVNSMGEIKSNATETF